MGLIAAGAVPAVAGNGHGGGGGGGNPGSQPYIQFKSGGYSVTEGTSNAVIQVQRVPKGADAVNFSTNGSPNGAVGGADCTDPATDYVVQANVGISIGTNGVGTAYVPICNNSFFENSETVNLLLSQRTTTPVGGKITAQLTISDNDKAPVLSVDSQTGAEGTTQTFTVTASAANPLLPMSVHWSVSDGTATVADGDYNGAQSGNVAIAPNQTTATFDVASLTDDVFEPGPDEYFWVNLSSPVNASLSSTASSGKYNVQDINTAPTLSVDDVTDWEGNTIGFTVTRTGKTTSAATFDWTTVSNGSASATAVGDPNNICGVNGNDYVSAAATGASIPAGGATGSTTVNITTCDDTAVEDNETFSLQLSNASYASISDNSGTGTIKDNDAASLTMSPQGSYVGGTDVVTYTATVKNTAGNELKGALVRFEAYGSDGAEYDSSGFYAFQQADLTGPGYAGFDVTGDDADVNSNPATESDGQATVVLPATGATYDDVVMGCVVSSVAASPGCAGVTDHNDDADGDARTGHNVTIDDTAFAGAEGYGYVFIL